MAPQTPIPTVVPLAGMRLVRPGFRGVGLLDTTCCCPIRAREDSMGRRGYPAEFRQRVLDLVAAGRRVEDVARDLGISDQTIYSWRRQDRIDQGVGFEITSSVTLACRGLSA
jgi:Transposase